MRRTKLATTVGCVTALALIPKLGLAASSEPVTLGTLTTARTVIVGVTLGENWDGFPSRMVPDYTNTASTSQLDATLPLYVNWIFDTDSSFTAHVVNPPRPITDYDWFVYDEFSVDAANISSLDQLYTACPDGGGLESPVVSSYPLTSGGELTIADIHGGIGTKTLLQLSRSVASPSLLVLALTGWVNPGTRFDDYLTEDLNLAPDFVTGAAHSWTRQVGFVIGGTEYHAFFDSRCVEWVSGDFGNVSRRIVDAGDAAAFSSLWGSGGDVRWGWATGESPANSPNFQADQAPWANPGDLDASDIAGFASHWQKSCGLSKAGDEDDITTVFAWFGYTPTGHDVVIGPNGETAPGWELTDPEQQAIGIANPFGYRDQINGVRSIDWTEMKRLYR